MDRCRIRHDGARHRVHVVAATEEPMNDLQRKIRKLINEVIQEAECGEEVFIGEGYVADDLFMTKIERLVESEVARAKGPNAHLGARAA
jgi:ribosomal protein S3AE